MVYVITNMYQDYEYPDDTFTEVVGVYGNILHAEEALKETIKHTFDSADWDSDDEYDEYIKQCMRSEDCFIDDTHDDRYHEIKITESPYYD